MNAQGETGTVVRLVFKLLARLFPFHPPPGREHIRLAKLRPQFRRWEYANVALLHACAPFTVWGAKAALAAALPPSTSP